MWFFTRLINWVRSPSIKFPYRFKFIEFGEIPNPFAELEVLTPLGWQRYGFLVDSGADTTTLPLFLAKTWSVSLKKEEKTLVLGVEGKGVMGYPAKIKVRLGGEEMNLRCYFIDAQVTPLLGRLDFWDKFNLTFDNRQKQIILQKI